MRHATVQHNPRPRPSVFIDIYVFAGAENLEELAIATSLCTLHLKLHLITHKIALKMGISYHHRLLKLHGLQVESLKAMLDSPIYLHVAKPHCSVKQRQVVSRAYTLATAQVFFNASPGKSQTTICGSEF